LSTFLRVRLLSMWWKVRDIPTKGLSGEAQKLHGKKVKVLVVIESD